MATRVAINGFGRIGRAFFRLAVENPEIEVVAINDLGDLENLAYLLKYDSAYGAANFKIETDKTGGFLIVNDRRIKFLSEKEPQKLPWADLNIDVVVESTGFFASYTKSKAHLDAGSKRVVITAPAPDTGGETVLMGINEKDLENCKISSNASCTTNAGSPVVEILRNTIGIEKAILNTVHAYTASQKLVDSPNPHNLREGRAAASNIIPSDTGSATATAKAIKELANKFDGVSMRIPLLTGSIADITFISSKITTAEEVNDILRKASSDARWAGIFTATDEQIVSSDIVGDKHASIADLSMTRVVDGNLVKVLAWYDNEMGYAHSLLRHVIASGKCIKQI